MKILNPHFVAAVDVAAPHVVHNDAVLKVLSDQPAQAEFTFDQVRAALVGPREPAPELVAVGAVVAKHAGVRRR